MNQEKTYEVTVFGKDWEHSYHRINGIRVAEGCLLLTSDRPGQPYKAYGHPLSSFLSWDINEEMDLSS